MNKTIGLVGYPGSGKSFIGRIFENNFGFSYISADEIGHIVLQEKINEISEVFGDIVLDDLGKTINRKTLGNLVFNNSVALDKLNKIVHPSVVDYIREFAKGLENKVIESALLFEVGLDDICDEVWFVDVPLEVRQKRVAKRGWTCDQLASREINILSEEEFRKRSDRILFNVKSEENMIQEIKNYIN